MGFLTNFSIILLLVSSEDFLTINKNDVTSTEVLESPPANTVVEGFTDVIYVDSLKDWARKDHLSSHCEKTIQDSQFESVITQKDPTFPEKAGSNLAEFEENLKKSIISELKDEIASGQQIEVNIN